MQASTRAPDRASPNVMVIFGASGDLTSRKLIPALYHLFKDRLGPEQFAVLGGEWIATVQAFGGFRQVAVVGRLAAVQLEVPEPDRVEQLQALEVGELAVAVGCGAE